MIRQKSEQFSARFLLLKGGMAVAWFAPLAYKRRITDITKAELVEWGIKALFLDVDNTLTAHNSQDVPADVKKWLIDRKTDGFFLTVVSNARRSRVAPFAEKIGLHFTSAAAKPLPIGFVRTARRLSLACKQCLVVGDQVFTDIWGANLCGMPSVQLMPMDLASDNAFVRFKRKLERPVTAHYMKKRGVIL